MIGSIPVDVFWICAGHVLILCCGELEDLCTHGRTIMWSARTAHRSDLTALQQNLASINLPCIESPTGESAREANAPAGHTCGGSARGRFPSSISCANSGVLVWLMVCMTSLLQRHFDSRRAEPDSLLHPWFAVSERCALSLPIIQMRPHSSARSYRSAWPLCAAISRSNLSSYQFKICVPSSH
jgi:hypothetical protein